MKKYLITIGCLVFYIACFSQNKEKPSWLGEVGIPVSDNYDYYIGTGVDANEQKAREIAVLNVKEQISDEIFAEYEIDKNSSSSFNNVQDGDNVKTQVKYEFEATIKQTGKKISITGIREVETYREGNKYYVLFRKPKKGVNISSGKDKLYTFDNSHKWKSIIFPGWGQMTVGKKKRGTFFLIGGGVFAAGIVTSQTLYSINHTNYTNALNEGDLTNSDIYQTNRDTWGTIRNINVVGFAGIYIFNLIDAFSTQGNKLYSSNTKRLKIYPSASPNSLGMGLCLKLN